MVVEMNVTGTEGVVVFVLSRLFGSTEIERERERMFRVSASAPRSSGGGLSPCRKLTWSAPFSSRRSDIRLGSIQEEEKFADDSPSTKIMEKRGGEERSTKLVVMFRG